MPHTCSTALVRCTDFRLGPAIRDYLNDKDLYGNVDIISIAGAAKDIAESDNSFPEKQIDLSKHLHDIKSVILMNHTDCDGYGGRGAFDNENEERKAHIADMEIAKAKIQAKHPSITVKLALAKIDENNLVSIEEI